MKHLKNAAFTITELIIVITVIGILAVITVVAYNGVTQRANDNAILSDLEKVATLQTDYALDNQTGGKAWYSPDGIDEDLGFTPSSGNTIDVVANNVDYCIRGFNPASNHPTLAEALIKESSDGACDTLSPSSAALADVPGPSFDTLTFTERTAAGERDWAAAAMSSDGTFIAAAVSDGYIYTSSDGGATWEEKTASGARSWTDISMSDDGAVIAASFYGQVSVSTDSGDTWTLGGSPNYWESVTVSGDGSTIYAGTIYIYKSTNGGASWSQMSVPFAGSSWISLATSTDGTFVAGSRNGGNIHYSDDGGASWSALTQAGTSSWGDITISDDGQNIAVYPQNGSILVSADAGATWTDTTVGFGYCNGLTASSDGSKLAASARTGGTVSLFTSIDAGAAWVEHDFVETVCNGALASSSNGSSIVVGLLGGPIYTGQFGE
tara:strand:- start:1363 stop:2676 length:1314 start_codon:yes stop_codon:yes gene_type:complete